MPEPQVAPAETPAGVYNWFVRTTLIVFTLLVSALCVMLLASTLTQSRVNAMATSAGVNMNVMRLNDVRQQWSSLRTQLSSVNLQLNAAAKDKQDAEAQYQLFRKSFDVYQGNINDKLKALCDKLQPVDPAFFAVVADDQHQNAIDRMHELQDKRADLIAKKPELQAELDSVVAAVAAYEKADYAQYIVWQHKRTDLAAKVTLLETQQKALSDAIANVISANVGPNLDPTARSSIENAFYELYTTQPGGEVLNSLIVLPTDILTLTLVVNEQSAEKVGVYLLRLTVGAVTALVIFIVTKAGLPVLADPSKNGGEAAVNPFFISFVAIVSGLLSENAIRFVEAQGNKFFGVDDGADKTRWARTDLRQMLKAANRNPENLRRALKVSTEQFDSWMSGAEAMPAPVQTLTASVLEAQPRDLFTDQPPG